jgi:phosphoribosyl 1,2-cyclic phosphodiesterase
MQFCVLGSGSRGNCTFVSADNISLLIDAGFSGIEISRRLEKIGADPSSLSAILITHEHSDHISGAGVLSRRYKIPLWLNTATAATQKKALLNPYKQNIFSTGKYFMINGLTIHPFSVCHDAAEPVGFIIEHQGVCLGYCTDTGIASKLISFRLSKVAGMILEFNHDPDLLKNGPYPLYLQQRIRSKEGHLANADAARFLKSIIHPGMQAVVLAHLSQTNNDPELVMRAVRETLSQGVGTTGQPDISIASQDKPGKLIVLK